MSYPLIMHLFQTTCDMREPRQKRLLFKIVAGFRAAADFHVQVPSIAKLRKGAELPFGAECLFDAGNVGVDYVFEHLNLMLCRLKILLIQPGNIHRLHTRQLLIKLPLHQPIRIPLTIHINHPHLLILLIVLFSSDRFLSAG